MPKTDQTEPRGELAIRTIAMPADTNANGDIFGGWVLARMDQAGGVMGVSFARGRVVTASLQAMSFLKPVKVGDVLSVYTQVTRVGRTSFDLRVEAWAQRFLTREHVKVTEGTFTFVAIDDSGKPRVLPDSGGPVPSHG